LSVEERRQVEPAYVEPEGAPQAPAEEDRTKAFTRGVLEVLQALAIAVLISVGLNLFVVQVTEVRQRSMENTLYSNDRVLVSKVDYRLHGPVLGDIIVFKPPIDANIPYVKRVIGLPGDVIDLRDGHVLVNGRELDEPYAVGVTTPRSGQVRFPFKVPAGSLFVLGDNRTVSGDSREWGAVPEENIIGKVIVKFWPLNEARFFDW
jgi:signal peptidase I